MDNMTARVLLSELREASDLLPAWEVAERASAILDRSSLKPLDVTEYVTEYGFEGYSLAVWVGRFSDRVRDEFIKTHGTPPLKRLALIAGELRRVYAYIEDDRELFDRVWNQISTEYGEATERLRMTR